MISNQEIVKILQESFRPLSCGAETWDYNEKIRFRIYGPSDTVVFQKEDVVIRNYSDPVDLKTLIMGVRELLFAKGFHLEPWDGFK